MLELKNHMEPDHIREIIARIRREGWLENTIFISFDLENMLSIRRLLPDQKAQYLIGGEPDWPALMSTLTANRLDLDIHYRLLSAQRVKELHEAGIEINVWTVDFLEDARRLADWGVDYITSNIIE